MPAPKLGRRELGRVIAAAAVAVAAPQITAQTTVQTPLQTGGQPQASADPFLRQAREERAADAREIARVTLPRTVEPAFRFKA